MSRDEPRRRGAIRMALTATLLGTIATTPLASPELARKHACMGCHAVNEKVAGPSFVEVAKRYAEKPAAVETIAKSIASGSKGAWGEMPMPAQPQLSVQEAETLARWVMAAGK